MTAATPSTGRWSSRKGKACFQACTAELIDGIRRRFGPGMLVVDDAERSNRIVIACAGDAMLRGIGEVKRPRSLSKMAWAQLVMSFVRIRSAQLA